MLDVDIVFYENDSVQTRTTEEEYKGIMEWLNRLSHDKDFVAFEVLNGKGEITFRPVDVKYIIRK